MRGGFVYISLLVDVTSLPAFVPTQATLVKVGSIPEQTLVRHAKCLREWVDQVVLYQSPSTLLFFAQ